MTKERDSNIELLRIILMFMIVLLHVFDNQVKNDYNATVMTMQCLVSFLCIVGVNVFVIISGYYGIKLKAKSIFSLVTQALFYSWSILAICFLIEGKSIGLRDIAMSIFPILSGQWWFLTLYMVLILVAPFINNTMEGLSKQMNKTIIVGLFILDIASCLFRNDYLGADGYSILHFILIYTIARYIRLYDVNVKYGTAIYLSATLMLFGANMALYFFKNGLIHGVMWGYNNPLVIIGSLGLFFAFKNLKLKSNKLINTIAPLTFGVYLIHNHKLLWRSYAEKFLEKMSIAYQDNVITLFFILLAFATIVYITCLVIEYLRNVFIVPVFDKIWNTFGQNKEIKKAIEK